MITELGASKFRGVWIRIHDSGDFFTDNYLLAWLRIMHARPEVNFYAYTKEVERFRRLVEPCPPSNFRWVYSYGGTQDAVLDPAIDRVADVFPTEAAIVEAGWSSQEDSDLLAVLGPRMVGVAANNIPVFLKRQGHRRFSQWQEEETTRKSRRHLQLVSHPDGDHATVVDRQCAA